MQGVIRKRPGAAPRQEAERLGSALPPLLVEAERVAQTVAQGVHGRRRVGQGETFWQFRRYQPGDSTTAIDWRQTAKSQAIFVRETEWEAAQSVWLWRDSSASMDYASGAKLRPKQERAELLLLATAALLVRGGERVALLGGGQLPATGRTGFNRLADAVLNDAPDNRSLPPPAPLPRAAHLVLFSDFLSEPEEIQATVSSLAGRGVRGQMVQILDPAEESLPFTGRIRFSGFEGEGQTLLGRVENVRESYRERLARHRAALGEIARRAGWGFILHHTDRPPQTALLPLYTAMAGASDKRRR
ncbi:MAG: DUF58 domain-containing protein [Alphaproteobacteria bacterium]|nr:DUF58 domain-containing protein [Alphaproteobacteria bacterium]